jgi:transposase
VQIFVRYGIDTLCTLHSGGNEAHLTLVEQQQLIVWLDAGVRTTKEAIAWVESTFHVSYTESGMYKLLQRLDYRYKKPAPVPASADPDAQQVWLEQYAEKN